MKYKKSVHRTFALITQLGISMIVPILLCVWVGGWPVSYTHLDVYKRQEECSALMKNFFKELREKRKAEVK